jgi:eight-cysteine-cluster-containing protein
VAESIAMKIRVTLLAFFVATVGCTSMPEPRADLPAPGATPSGPDPSPVPAAGSRTPAVPKDSPHYDLFEGTSYKNDCAKDSDCSVGGCSHEVCSAQAGVKTSCIAHADSPHDATCGCVSGQCIWYR